MPKPNADSAAKLGPVDPNVAPASAVGLFEIPTEIPRFALVGERTASGLVPFAEGYSWLRQKGYRTLLLVKAPGDEDRLIAEEAKKAGLAFQTIEVAPSLLDREKADLFTLKLREEGPVFVCDKNGELAGALWFLHFRLSDAQTEAAALARAKRLGLKEPAESEAAKELLEAARKVAL